MLGMTRRERTLAKRWAAEARLFLRRGDDQSRRRDEMTVSLCDAELAEGWPPEDDDAPQRNRWWKGTDAGEQQQEKA